MKNQGIKLSVPKLVVILHYVEFIMTAIQKIVDGKKEVDSSYYLGTGIYVTWAFPYRNVSIRLWKWLMEGNILHHKAPHLSLMSGMNS